jgi:hypothetical protein
LNFELGIVAVDAHQDRRLGATFDNQIDRSLHLFEVGWISDIASHEFYACRLHTLTQDVRAPPGKVIPDYHVVALLPECKG